MITSIFIWIGDGSAIDLLWKPAPLFADFGISVFHILAAGIWMLPFTGWLLLASSIAKKDVRLCGPYYYLYLSVFLRILFLALCDF